MINRRSLITGLISFVAAPAIIRVSNIMPINSDLLLPDEFTVPLFWAEVDVSSVPFTFGSPHTIAMLVQCQVEGLVRSGIGQ